MLLLVSPHFIATGNGLHQIWDLVLPKDSVLQSKGLVALALQNTFMVWLNRKPTGLGSITGERKRKRKRERAKE